MYINEQKPITGITVIEALKKAASHKYKYIDFDAGASIQRCQKCGLNWLNYITSQDNSYIYMSTLSPVTFTEATTEDILICPNIQKGYINSGSYNGTR